MHRLRVASLNFSAINTSPFEYHDGTHDKNTLNTLFKQELDRYTIQNPNADWNIAKIDKIFSKERYSILYKSDCGYVRGKLLNQQKFEAIWDRTFDLNRGIVGHVNLDQKLVDHLRSFDWMAYKAFLRLVFGDVDFSNIYKFDVVKYILELKKWHQKSYLDQERNLEYVKEYILNNQIDVMFIQEANNKRSEDFLPNSQYSLIHNAQSLIVYKKDTYFIEDRDNLEEFNSKYKQKLNFNNDSAFLKSKNILLVCGHLSSKSINLQQGNQMLQTLAQIKEEYEDLVIIVGVDANHQLPNHHRLKQCPNTKAPTTRKKRTHLQCQFQKAGKLIQQTKDYIITSEPISSWKIQTIKSQDISLELLPNDAHPFDHFVVSAQVEFDKSKYRSLCRGSTMHTNLEFRIGSGESTIDNISSFSYLPNLIGMIVPPQESIANRRRTFTSETLKQQFGLLKSLSLYQKNYDPNSILQLSKLYSKETQNTQTSE